MTKTPKDTTISRLWEERRSLMSQVHLRTEAINALQKLCEHKNEYDVSRHGSPDMECPDCGKGMLP